MLFRDGDVVVARWFADKADAAHPYLRFVGDGQASMPVDEVTHGLTDFVIRVLDRIEEMDAPEIEALRRDCARHGRALDRGRPRRCTGLAAANEPALAHGGRRWNAHETGYECARTLRRHLGANGGPVEDMRAVMRAGWAQEPLLTTDWKPTSPLDAYWIAVQAARRSSSRTRTAASNRSGSGWPGHSSFVTSPQRPDAAS